MFKVEDSLFEAIFPILTHYNIILSLFIWLWHKREVKFTDKEIAVIKSHIRTVFQLSEMAKSNGEVRDSFLHPQPLYHSHHKQTNRCLGSYSFPSLFHFFFKKKKSTPSPPSSSTLPPPRFLPPRPTLAARHAIRSAMLLWTASAVSRCERRRQRLWWPQRLRIRQIPRACRRNASSAR